MPDQTERAAGRRRVLVTAGANGIGLAITEALTAQGDDVVVADVDKDALRRVHESLGVEVIACDIAAREAVDAMVDAAVARLGGLDVVVSNAGISGPTAPIDAYDPDAWDRVVAVNLTGSFNLARRVAPHLRKSRGALVLMSSVAGRFGYPGRSAYSATKWGLVGLTKTLAMELGDDGVRVNAILPGAVSGPRLDAVFASRAANAGVDESVVRAESIANQSLKSLVSASDVADLAVFLTSPGARMITGQAIALDGDKQSAL